MNEVLRLTFAFELPGHQSKKRNIVVYMVFMCDSERQEHTSEDTVLLMLFGGT